MVPSERPASPTLLRVATQTRERFRRVLINAEYTVRKAKCSIERLCFLANRHDLHNRCFDLPPMDIDCDSVANE